MYSKLLYIKIDGWVGLFSSAPVVSAPHSCLWIHIHRPVCCQMAAHAPPPKTELPPDYFRIKPKQIDKIRALTTFRWRNNFLLKLVLVQWVFLKLIRCASIKNNIKNKLYSLHLKYILNPKIKIRILLWTQMLSSRPGNKRCIICL